MRKAAGEQHHHATWADNVWKVQANQTVDKYLSFGEAHYKELLAYEMDHQAKKSFELGMLHKHMTSLLLKGDKGLEDLLHEFRICNAVHYSQHLRHCNCHYPVNPYSKNLLTYKPTGLTPKQVIEDHKDFQKFVKDLWDGRADLGCMPELLLTALQNNAQ